MKKYMIIDPLLCHFRSLRHMTYGNLNNITIFVLFVFSTNPLCYGYHRLFTETYSKLYLQIVNILSKIIKGSANLFSLCLTLIVTLFKIQNNVCRQWPFEIISYTDEQLGNINGLQKANGSNKIHPEDS